MIDMHSGMCVHDMILRKAGGARRPLGGWRVSKFFSFVALCAERAAMTCMLYASHSHPVKRSRSRLALVACLSLAPCVWTIQALFTVEFTRSTTRRRVIAKHHTQDSRQFHLIMAKPGSFLWGK